MTTLALFRISTSLGALLFFVAGFVLAGRRQGQRAQAQILPQRLYEPQSVYDKMAADAEIGRAEQASLKLQRTELEGRLLASCLSPQPSIKRCKRSSPPA